MMKSRGSEPQGTEERARQKAKCKRQKAKVISGVDLLPSPRLVTTPHPHGGTLSPPGGGDGLDG